MTRRERWLLIGSAVGINAMWLVLWLFLQFPTQAALHGFLVTWAYFAILYVVERYMSH